MNINLFKNMELFNKSYQTEQELILISNINKIFEIRELLLN